MSEEAQIEATLKLPQAFEGLTINIRSLLDIGEIEVKQTEPKYIDDRWIINVYLERHESFPRKYDPPKAG